MEVKNRSLSRLISVFSTKHSHPRGGRQRQSRRLETETILYFIVPTNGTRRVTTSLLFFWPSRARSLV